MKKIALLLIVTLILGTSIILVSCSENSEISTACEHKWQKATTSTPKTCKICGKTEGLPLSAYDVLNSDEKDVFRALKNFASTLGAPSSLKLIELKAGQTSASDSTKHVFAKISANNVFGTPVSEVYVVNYDNLSSGGSAWYIAAGAWYHYGSVPKINAALQEYFDSMGW